MNLTTRFGRLLVGTAVLGAILTPATVAGAQVGPDDITDDPCQPELEDCSPDPCPLADEVLFKQPVAGHPENDDCPDPCPEELPHLRQAAMTASGGIPECPEPCEGEGEGEGLVEAGGDECEPEPCTDEAECPGPGTDPDPDPYDPPVVGEPNFTG